MSEGQLESSGYRALPQGRRPVRCMPRDRSATDRGEPGGQAADASGVCPDCNDLEIDGVGIWVLVECSPNQCVYELTAASRDMFDDDWKLRI